MTDEGLPPPKPAPPAPASPKLQEAQIYKLLAEADAFQAQCKKDLAEAKQARVEARKAKAEAKQYEVETRAAIRKERQQLAADVEHHVYNFIGAVDGTSVRLCMAKLTEWSRLDPGCSIELRFNSPGGNVIDGMALFDYLCVLRRSGHHLTTVAYGYAASMAGILLQTGDHRIIGRESYLLIHELSASTYGKVGEMKDDVKFYDVICERVVGIFTERSGGKTSKTVFHRAWKRTDWWLDSAECLRRGFVDEIR